MDKPAPLTGLDDAPTGFTYDSIHRRLARIVDDIVPAMPASSHPALNTLKSEIEHDAKLTPLDADQEDADWDAYGSMYEGQSWLSAPWFYVENYFYKRLLDIVRQHGGPSDPFIDQKRAALATAEKPFVDTVLPLLDTRDAAKLLYRSLWGNRADLSLHAVSALASHKHGEDEDDDSILADDAGAAVKLLQDASAAAAVSVSIILDNCGLELLSDLVLAEGLLRLGLASRVALWCKRWPVFVSDAMIKDVHEHVDWMQQAKGQAASQLAASLRSYLSNGTLVLRDHRFFTSPLPYWDAPSDLTAALRGEALTICKGDANYRRLLGDRHWRHDTPFAHVTAYFPCSLLALRTCKAGLAVGVTPQAEAAAAARHPTDWLVSGRYGLIQLMTKQRE